MVCGLLIFIQTLVWLNSRFEFILEPYDFELANASNPVTGGTDNNKEFLFEEKEGYKPLGIVGYTLEGDYNSRVSVYRLYINTFLYKFYLGFRIDDAGISSNLLSVTMYVLYVPSA